MKVMEVVDLEEMEVVYVEEEVRMRRMVDLSFLRSGELKDCRCLSRNEVHKLAESPEELMKSSLSRILLQGRCQV